MDGPSIRGEFDRLEDEHGEAVSLDARYLGKAILAATEAIIERMDRQNEKERRNAA
jgi:hypothetical protein